MMASRKNRARSHATPSTVADPPPPDQLQLQQLLAHLLAPRAAFAEQAEEGEAATEGNWPSRQGPAHALLPSDASTCGTFFHGDPPESSILPSPGHFALARNESWPTRNEGEQRKKKKGMMVGKGKEGSKLRRTKEEGGGGGGQMKKKGEGEEGEGNREGEEELVGAEQEQQAQMVLAGALAQCLLLAGTAGPATDTPGSIPSLPLADPFSMEQLGNVMAEQLMNTELGEQTLQMMAERIAELMPKVGTRVDHQQRDGLQNGERQTNGLIGQMEAEEGEEREDSGIVADEEGGQQNNELVMGMVTAALMASCWGAQLGQQEEERRGQEGEGEGEQGSSSSNTHQWQRQRRPDDEQGAPMEGHQNGGAWTLGQGQGAVSAASALSQSVLKSAAKYNKISEKNRERRNTKQQQKRKKPEKDDKGKGRGERDDEQGSSGGRDPHPEGDPDGDAEWGQQQQLAALAVSVLCQLAAAPSNGTENPAPLAAPPAPLDQFSLFAMLPNLPLPVSFNSNENVDQLLANAGNIDIDQRPKGPISSDEQTKAESEGGERTGEDEGEWRRKKPKGSGEGTGTGSAKGEKSLGALLRQQPPGAEKAEELVELEQFAGTFKKQRIKHGFTQGDVGVALGNRYGTDFSQTTISRFEALNLSYKNMCKLRPLLQDWLEETERELSAGATVRDVLEGVARTQSQQVQAPEGGQQSAQQPSTAPSLPSAPSGIENGLSGFGASLFSSASSSFSALAPFKKRRKRTNLDTGQKGALDAFFRMEPRPDNARLNQIATALQLEQDVVRVWFCNRRQKLRKF